MDRHRNAFRTKVLTIVWMLTAATALVLSVVYFEKLQKMYSQIEITQQARAAGGKKGQPAGGTSGSEAKTGEADPGTSEPAKTEDIQIVNPADREDFDGYDNAESKDPQKTAADGDSQGEAFKNPDFDYTTGIDPDKPVIALSFDDGPSQYTERIVAALTKNHASATFFMVGYNVQNHKSLVRLVYDSGFEIGNHTSDHKRLTDLSRKDITSEVFDNEDLINSVIPAGELVVRPPYGSYNETVGSVVQRPMFNWSVDSQDWKTRDADSIVTQIKKDAKDGYIVLMHDLYESTAEAAERIIPWLINEGYQVTDISTMFKARGVKPENGELYRYAPALSKEE